MIKKAIYLVVIIIGAFSLYQTASAQTPTSTDQLGNYSVTSNCLLTINYGKNLNFPYAQFYGTSQSRIGFANGFWPDTTLYQLGKIGYSAGALYDWYAPTYFPETASTTSSITFDAKGNAGNYYLWYQTGSDIPLYFQFTRLTSTTCETYNAQLPNEQTNTLDFLTKFTGATVQGASTTVNFDVSYFLNTPEYTANTRPDLIQVLVGRDGFGQVALAREFILPLTDGNHTKNVPVNYNQPDTQEFIDGDYYAYINFWNITTDTLAFNKTNVVLTFTIDNGLVINQQVVSLTDGTEISANIQYQDCSLSNIQGCLVNAFIYVFVPAPNAFDKFLNLWERIEYKPPFGYVVSILDALNGLTDNATPAFSFGDIPFLNDIFTPFRSLLIIGQWVLYTLFFMGRLSKLQL